MSKSSKRSMLPQDAYRWASEHWSKAFVKYNPTAGYYLLGAVLDGGRLAVWGKGDGWHEALEVAKDQIKNIGKPLEIIDG